ncbi:MAG: DUF2530 domain-containing protein [Phycicoccus sp.]|nr:DUF2530 domain-containing protein [Phycicoccus sp.]
MRRTDCFPGDPNAADDSTVQALEPLRVPTRRIIIIGQIGWVIALALTLAIPSWHSGDRSWWPWTCVAGLALGGIGYVYVSRGRGNAAGAE